jgi:alpha-tubulin suppressor-like RCC1 family protein
MRAIVMASVGLRGLCCAWLLFSAVGCGFRTGLLDAARAREDHRPDQAAGDTGGQTADAAPDATMVQVGDAAGAPDIAFADAGKAILKVAVYSAHSAALLSDGTVMSWGYNKGAQLGDGTNIDRSTPVAVAGLSNVVELGAGSQCALLADAKVKCWGTSAGELPDGGVPVPVSMPDLQGAVALASGSSFACARINDGRVKCWGSNGFGRLGDGTTTRRSSPVLVQGLDGVVHLSTGPDHSCACLADGTARCWGWGGTGCLGDGSTNWTVPTPVDVRDLSGAVEVASGTYHACARLAGGGVKCWGFNREGELGNGTTSDTSIPVGVVGVNDAKQIFAGTQHTCARLSDATVKCWGHNGHGALGDGTTTNRPTPVEVRGLSDVVELAVGSSAAHVCARLGSGVVKCWGLNSYGQLGDGTTTDRASPVEVVGIP